MALRDILRAAPDGTWRVGGINLGTPRPGRGGILGAIGDFTIAAPRAVARRASRELLGAEPEPVRPPGGLTTAVNSPLLPPSPAQPRIPTIGGAAPFVHEPLHQQPIAEDGPVAGIDWGGVIGDLGRELIGGLTGGRATPSEPAQGSPAIPGSLTGQPSGCPPGTIRIPGTLQCVSPGDMWPGGAPGVVPTSPAPMTAPGMLGAVQPQATQQRRLRCPRGYVLGADELCYHRSAISNKQRKWPKGRKPLLTGGDLNAISRAARAAGRMKTQQKRLQKLGLLPKPGRGRGRSSSRRSSGGVQVLKPGKDFTIIDTD